MLTLSVSHSTVGQWLSGEILLAWGSLKAISRPTGGSVTPNDFAVGASAAGHALPEHQDTAA